MKILILVIAALAQVNGQFPVNIQLPVNGQLPVNTQFPVNGRFPGQQSLNGIFGQAVPKPAGTYNPAQVTSQIPSNIRDRLANYVNQFTTGPTSLTGLQQNAAQWASNIRDRLTNIPNQLGIPTVAPGLQQNVAQWIPYFGNRVNVEGLLQEDLTPSTRSFTDRLRLESLQQNLAPWTSIITDRQTAASSKIPSFESLHRNLAPFTARFTERLSPECLQQTFAPFTNGWNVLNFQGLPVVFEYDLFRNFNLENQQESSEQAVEKFEPEKVAENTKTAGKVNKGNLLPVIEKK